MKQKEYSNKFIYRIPLKIRLITGKRSKDKINISNACEINDAKTKKKKFVTLTSINIYLEMVKRRNDSLR